MLKIFRIKESKVCIQLSLSIHQESRDEIRQNPPTNWRKITFFSLSTLDAKGYRYSSEGGVLKVSKGTLVVLEGQLSHGIYTLMGTACIGEVAASTTPMVEDDITKL